VNGRRAVLSKSGKVAGLTISIAVYNEREAVERAVGEALAALERFAEQGEVLITDDGSTDGTGAIADRLAASDPRVRVVHQENLGFSGAIRTGMTNARFEVIFQVPADGEVVLDDFCRAMPLLDSSDIVVPYRQDVRDRPWRRTFFSRLSHTILGAIYRFKLPEISFCYIVRRAVLETVHPRATPHTATYAPELIFRAIRQGYAVRSVPFGYRPRRTGIPKGTRLAMVLRTFFEFLAIAPSVYAERRLAGGDR
jgi:dolichol-phosphate mannosyltransferase